jgi:hypothetical protein
MPAVLQALFDSVATKACQIPQDMLQGWPGQAARPGARGPARAACTCPGTIPDGNPVRGKMHPGGQRINL